MLPEYRDQDNSTPFDPLKEIDVLEEQGLLTSVFQYDTIRESDGYVSINSTVLIAPNRSLANKADIDTFLESLPQSNLNTGREPEDRPEEGILWLPRRNYFIKIGALKTTTQFEPTSGMITAPINNKLLEPHIGREHQREVYHGLDVTMYPSIEFAQAVATLTIPHLHRSYTISKYDRERPAIDLSGYDEEEFRGFDAFIPSQLWPEKLI